MTTAYLPSVPQPSAKLKALVTVEAINDIAALVAQATVDRNYQLPYVAGVSNDCKVVYYDSSLPEMLSDGQHNFHSDAGVAWHECGEWYFMTKLGLVYDDAHCLVTWMVEHPMVTEILRLDFAGYQHAFDPYVTADEHETLTACPPQLFMAPYQDDASAELLTAIKRAQRTAAFGGVFDAQVAAAGVALVTADGKALFLRYAPGHDHAGEWAFPGGGVEAGEMPETAALRECEEETGYRPTSLTQVADTVNDRVNYVTFFVAVEVFTPTLDDGENDNYSWALLSEPPQPLHPGVALALQAVRAHGDTSAGLSKINRAGFVPVQSVDELPFAPVPPAPKTLYVNRPLQNADELIAWAKAQGFSTTLPVDDMHVTIAFSKAPVDWSRIVPEKIMAVVADNNGRSIEQFGGGAVVLRFNSAVLQQRWRQFCDIGASWDWDGYKPHVTISYNGDGLDLAAITPYSGDLIFGPEEFAEVSGDWKDNIKESLAKADTVNTASNLSWHDQTSASNTMPWKSNDHLPDHVKGSLPKEAQDVFREVANRCMSNGDSDVSAIKQAWTAVKNGWQKKDGAWVRKQSTDKMAKGANDMSDQINFFMPINKVEPQQDGSVIVTGYASTPTKDLDDEIISLDAIKTALPDYMEWRNIRAMHQPDAVGRAQEAHVDDVGLHLRARIVEPNAVKLVKEKIYQGYSIGGTKLAKTGNTVTALRLSEISIVDRPANGDCRFDITKNAKVIDPHIGDLLKVADAPIELAREEIGLLGRIIQKLSGNKPRNDSGHDLGSITINQVVDKRDVSDKERAALADAGKAMPDGSYPIANADDLANAVQAFGRAKNKPAVKRHIIRRAKDLKATDKLPADWSDKMVKSASLPTVVSMLGLLSQLEYLEECCEGEQGLVCAMPNGTTVDCDKEFTDKFGALLSQFADLSAELLDKVLSAMKQEEVDEALAEFAKATTTRKKPLTFHLPSEGDDSPEAVQERLAKIAGAAFVPASPAADVFQRLRLLLH